MRRAAFNKDWQFRRHAKFFEEATGAADEWRSVTLPHDATLAEDRVATSIPASGYFPGGVYEYRTTLAAPIEFRDHRVILDFEGVYRGAMVYVNGSLAGQWASGYTGFTVPLDDFLQFGLDNEIRVVCRAHVDSRWYAGAGIHRPVHLVVGGLLHIALDGIRVRTRSTDDDFATIEVTTTLEQEGRGLRTVDAITEIRDADGVSVAAGQVPVSVIPGEPAVLRQRLLVPRPALWSPDTPNLYTASVTLRDGDVNVDEDVVAFGIRTVDVDPVRGLRINGVPTKLRGACIHSDNGVLGAATIDRADERRVELLKAAGFNALRNAHNPASRALLSACDQLGLLVMDEAWDTWTVSKSDFDYALDFPQWWEQDLESMVRQDANHPSVIFYSIGNEIPELGKPHGALWSRRLAEKLRSLDDTRLITNGINGMLTVIGETTGTGEPPAAGGINTMMTEQGDFMKELSASDLVGHRTAESFGVLDVAGMNYMDARYESDGQQFPNRVIVGSETYPDKIDKLWRLVTDNAHVIGDFTWTGWDYLGEAGIGRVADSEDPTAGQVAGPYPWLLAWVGDLDITGHRRPASYYREIVFGLRTDPFLAVVRPEHSGRKTVGTPWAWSDSVDSWSFNDADSVPLTVEVYSDADQIELLLNGASQGTAPAGEPHRFKAIFEVPYVPGTLTAVATTAGVETGRFSLTSATGQPQLHVTADRPAIRSDETDLAYVTITLQDPDGTVFLGQDQQVNVTIDGPGVLQGLGSSAPSTEWSYRGQTCATFDGRALAVVRPEGPGEITVTTSTLDGQTSSVSIEAR